MTKAKRIWRKAVSLTAAAAMLATMVFGANLGDVSVKAADATATTTWSFADNAGKDVPVKGQVLPATNPGIIYAEESTNNVTFDSNQLKFRSGSCLLVPLKDDTTKITYTQKVSGNASGRPVYIGTDVDTYKVEAVKAGDSCTISDITDLIRVVDGKNYIALYSHGDVKVTEMTLVEYNPINRVTVSGKLDGAAENGITKVTFKKVDSGELTTVDVAADGTYSAVLKRIEGNTSYIATVSKTGFKLDTTDAANQFTLTGNDATATFNGKVVEAEVAKVSGTVAGVPDSFLKGDLKVEFVPADTTLNTIDANVAKVSDGNYTFTDVAIEPGMEYSVKLINSNDYEVLQTVKAEVGSTSGVALTATAKPVYDVTGAFVTANDKTADVKDITFTNMNEEGYSYTFTATSAGYTAKLRAGEYVTSATVDGYTVFDHVSVKDAAVSNDVYLDCPADTTPIEYKAELLVGKGKDYETIQDAVNAITRMDRPNGERVTIKLADSLYREQIIINTPNITIIPAEGVTPTVTWYYGIGYSYYSVAPATADKSIAGFYSEKYAVDKYEVTTVTTHWGTTVELREGAAGFKSENVIYESSFNRYMTTEEVIDGVGLADDQNKVDRSKATSEDVKKNVNKERACAMYIFADDVEYKNCQFLSSQDTLFTGNGEESIYFKDCIIEGTTDFICGSGNPVFDNCTLSIYGYGDKAADGGYITASKEAGSHGYLFWNCKVVRTTYEGINTSTKRVYFGRPWGAGTKMLVYNTEVESADLIHEAGYASMSNVYPKDAFYSEWNTHTTDGTKLDITSRAEGSIMLTDTEAAAVSLETWFDGWKPVYYYGESADTPVVPESNKVVVDTTAGFVTTETYGKAEVADVTVLQDMPFNSTEPATVDGVDYAGFAQGSSSAVMGANGLPESGAALKVEAKANGTLTFVLKAASTKTYYFVTAKDGALVKSVDFTPAESGSYTYNMVAGETYYLYAAGSKPMVYSIVLEKDATVATEGFQGGSSTPEQPTEKPTEAPTQAPTEAPTQKPTEAPTQAPTEAPTQKPTEAPTQAPTEAPTQKPTEAPTQKPTEAPTQKPTQAPTEAPTQKPTETPTQAPTTAPSDDVVVDGADKEAVKDVAISNDAKFEGDVKAEDVKLVVEKAVESVVTTVKAALETAGVKVADVDAKFYDVSLKAGNNVVKLTSGKVEITFAWAEGKSADKNDVKVYHYNNDKLEEVKATVTADGIKIEADEFSPYVVVYSAKTVEAPGTGDAAPIMFYIALCAMMLAAGAVVVSKKRA